MLLANIVTLRPGSFRTRIFWSGSASYWPEALWTGSAMTSNDANSDATSNVVLPGSPAQYPFRDYPRYGTNQNSPIFQSSSSSDTRSTRSNSDGPTDRSTGKPLDITNNPGQCHECTARWTHADPDCWCQPKLVIDESKDQNTDEQPDRPASQASTVEYSEEIKTEKE